MDDLPTVTWFWQPPRYINYTKTILCDVWLYTLEHDTAKQANTLPWIVHYVWCVRYFLKWLYPTINCSPNRQDCQSKQILTMIYSDTIQNRSILSWLQPCKPLLWLVRSLVHLVLRNWPWSVDVRCTPFVGDKHILQQTSPRFFATGPTSHDKLVVDGLLKQLSWPGPRSSIFLMAGQPGPPRNSQPYDQGLLTVGFTLTRPKIKLLFPGGGYVKGRIGWPAIALAGYFSQFRKQKWPTEQRC